MRTTPEFYRELQRLFHDYVKEVEGLGAAGTLKQNAVNTYIVYPQYFVRWVANDFEPGGRKKRKAGS